jgi:aromatic ring hydroxylase
MWLIPRTAADLGARRAVHRFWAEGSYGLQLVSDFVGTEFGGRQLQYEMFDSAPQPVVNTRMFRAYDWPGAAALVDRCLGEY